MLEAEPGPSPDRVGKLLPLNTANRPATSGVVCGWCFVFEFDMGGRFISEDGVREGAPLAGGFADAQNFACQYDPRFARYS